MDPFEQSLSGSDLDFPRKCDNRPDIDSLHHRFDTDNLSVQTRIFTRRFILDKAVHGEFTKLPFESIFELEENQKVRFILLFNSVNPRG